MRIRFDLLLALSLPLAVACGGGGGGDGPDPDDPVATTEGGETITTGGGTALSVQAHNYWTEAQEAFNAAEEAGWNEQACGRVRGKFNDAIEAQGNFAEALYMAGLAAERCNDVDEARRLYNRALQAAEAGLQRLRRENSDASPPANGPLCKARVALALLNSRDNAQAARQAYQRAIRDDPQCTSGYVNLAILQREAGGAQEAEALRNLRRALAIESDYLPAFNQMALLYYNRGLQPGNSASLDLAEVVCRQAQLIDRDYAPIYNTWGLVKIKKGEVIEALRYFERAISLDDAMFEAQMNFAQITISFRGYEDARRSFARAVELKPNDYEAHIGLGAALRGLENFDGAKSEYERAMQIDGNRPEAYFNLAVLHHDYISARAGGMNETIQELNTAKGFYQQFLSKAQGERYAETAEEVRRTCRENSESVRRRTGRQWRGNCRPGRVQLVDITVAALREADALQREAAQMQAEMEAQQQQQEGGDGGGE